LQKVVGDGMAGDGCVWGDVLVKFVGLGMGGAAALDDIFASTVGKFICRGY